MYAKFKSPPPPFPKITHPRVWVPNNFLSHTHLQACLACRGSILFTGVGKSGFIAQKISQTLISTGTRAMYLNPTDALHGDLVRIYSFS